MRKIHHDLHIPFAELGELSSRKLLAIDGPKFITKGHKTLAVLISHEKWKIMNHRLPNITPDRAGIFFIGDQAYMVLPVEQRERFHVEVFAFFELQETKRPSSAHHIPKLSRMHSCAKESF